MNSKYRCVNRRCSEYFKEFEMMHFQEYRLATGHSPRCHICGEFLRWLGNVKE